MKKIKNNKITTNKKNKRKFKVNQHSERRSNHLD